MKLELCIAIATYLVYCIDKELYRTIEYLKTHFNALIEQQKHQRIHIKTITITGSVHWSLYVMLPDVGCFSYKQKKVDKNGKRRKMLKIHS